MFRLDSTICIAIRSPCGTDDAGMVHAIAESASSDACRCLECNHKCMEKLCCRHLRMVQALTLSQALCLKVTQTSWRGFPGALTTALAFTRGTNLSTGIQKAVYFMISDEVMGRSAPLCGGKGNGDQIAKAQLRTCNSTGLPPTGLREIKAHRKRSHVCKTMNWHV